MFSAVACREQTAAVEFAGDEKLRFPHPLLHPQLVDDTLTVVGHEWTAARRVGAGIRGAYGRVHLTLRHIYAPCECSIHASDCSRPATSRAAFAASAGSYGP